MIPTTSAMITMRTRRILRKVIIIIFLLLYFPVSPTKITFENRNLFSVPLTTFHAMNIKRAAIRAMILIFI
jgi:hypothetical protein